MSPLSPREPISRKPPCLAVALLTALLSLGAVAAPKNVSSSHDASYDGLESRAAAGVGDDILVIQSTPDPKGFKLEFHQKLSGMKNPECTAMIDRAHWMQDIFLQSESRMHFDNCAFEEGIGFIQEMAAIVREQGKHPDDAAMRREALFALGRALHTIQDFYAHSTYVELMDKSAAANVSREEGLPVFKLWEQTARSELPALRKQELVSGTWAIGGPKKCGSSNKTHGELAKDSKATSSGAAKLAHAKQWKLENRFEAAFDLARRATLQFVNEVVPPELVKSCGGVMAALVLVDDQRPRE